MSGKKTTGNKKTTSIKKIINSTESTIEKYSTTEETSKSKILPVKTDVVFKLLFGDYRNSEILIDFLMSVLNLPPDEYESIHLDDTALKKENPEDKLGIVDVKLSTKTGKIVHIEIQVLEQTGMPERVIYYNSKMIFTQLKSAGKYFELQKTISVVITNYEIITNSTKYHHVFQLYDKESQAKFSDLIEINTLELKKMPLETDNTKKYDWLRFIRAEKEEEFELIAKNNPVIQVAYAKLKILSQDEEAQRIYEDRLKAIRDEEARNNFAINKGLSIGKEIGIKEGKNIGIKEGKDIGIKEGKEIGIKEGKEIGIKEGKNIGIKEGINIGAKKREIQIAKNLLLQNLPIESISTVTGLELEELEEISASLK